MAEKKVQKRTIESREKINTAALKLFCEKGYFNTNTKEIAKTAGISVGNFYNYYKDKLDVYYELTAQYIHGTVDYVGKLSRSLVQASDKRQMLADFINKQIQRASETDRFFKDCVVLVQDNTRLQDLYEVNTKNMISTIENMLMETPGIKKRASYQVMARLLFSMIDRLSEDASKITDQATKKEYCEQIILIVQDYLLGE